MRDLFREGWKLSESLARLPWKAARRAIGGRSETLRTAADLGERLGTLPFRASRRLLEEEQRTSGAAGQGRERGQTGAGSPRPEREAIGRAPQRYKARIVVLGAGYAGLTAFLELQERLSRNYDLVLVNGSRYHWFTTELHTYVAGEPEETVRIPLRRVVAPPGRLIVDRVERVDPQRQVVELESGGRLRFDLLIFGLGSDPEYYGLPGVEENSLIVGTWWGALKLRERITALLDGEEVGGSAPHVVVAGGGLTGVEVAGELADEYPDRLRLTIIEAGPEIMAGFAPELVRTAREVLAAKGIEILTGNPIAGVEPGRLTFRDGRTLDFDLLVWAGGVRGSAVVQRSGLATTPKGRARVDRYLRAEGYENLYVVGDSAAFVPPGEERALPPTAQAAVQMGRAAARNILRQLQGKPLEPFRPHIRGAFASLGRVEGVGQLGEGQTFTGLPAMMIKNFIEGHHAWEAGGGVMPLVSRILRAPSRMLRRRPLTRGKRELVRRPAARPEPRRIR